MVTLSVVALALFDGDHSVGVVMVVGELLKCLLVVTLVCQLMEAMLVLLPLMKTVVMVFVIMGGTDGFVIGLSGSSVGGSVDSGSGFVVDFLRLGGSHCVIILGGAISGSLVVAVVATGDGCDGSIRKYPCLDLRGQEWLGFGLVQAFSWIVLHS